jgi:autotransporter-associated beta strand protein
MRNSDLLKRLFRFSFSMCAALLALGEMRAKAANGTWTNPNGGSWTNSGNWSGGTIADASNNTANFGTLSLPSDATITLDTPRMIGSLIFDDQNGVKHSWVLNPGGANPLTLAGGTPNITVGSVATINAIVAGTNGLNKAGAGRLTLTAANLYSGTTVVNAGSLAFGTVSWSAGNQLNIASSSGAGESAGTLNLIVNATGTMLGVVGPGTLRLTSNTNTATTPDIYFGPNHSANSYWGARIATPLDLGSSQRFIFGKTGHNGVGQYGLTNADCQFTGPISGAGGLTIIAQNNWTGSSQMEAGFALNAADTFTGPLEIQRGSVYLGNAGALNQSNVLRFNPAAGNNARFFLYGRNASISDLSSSGAGAVVIANGNRLTGASLTLGAATLTIAENNPTTFGGTLGQRHDWSFEPHQERSGYAHPHRRKHLYRRNHRQRWDPAGGRVVVRKSCRGAKWRNIVRNRGPGRTGRGAERRQVNARRQWHRRADHQ